ncbi:MAG: putative transcriptional regulator, partial [Bacilli bacterium]|nr:putative transcriptional regulator [Bacilli bacterium]
MDLQLSISGYEQIYPYKYLALYHALRDAIAAGQIPVSTKLPSSRELGRLYQFSRGIVNQVYEMLAAEGYVVSAVGRGTYVLFDGGSKYADKQAASSIALSHWGKRIDQLPLRGRVNQTEVEYDFSLVQPDTQNFPLQDWNKLMYT